MTDLPSPQSTSHLLLHPVTEKRVTDALQANALTGGWLLTGAPNIGKASLAYSLAKTILSGMQELGAADDQTVRLVENGGHPDLFTVTRTVMEKTGRLRNDIVVDDIRRLIQALHQTASTGRRVVIIDRADDLNRAAANALLKILEEPPAGTLLLLLSSSPGRLLPTIRSRCRRLALAPVPDEALADWLKAQNICPAKDAPTIATSANGRPGRAILLASGEGEAARQLVNDLLNAVRINQDLSGVAQTLGAKTNDEIWPDVKALILDELSQTIRSHPMNHKKEGVFSAVPLPLLLKTHETLTAMLSQAEALNSDRTQTAYVMALTLRDAVRGSYVRG